LSVSETFHNYEGPITPLTEDEIAKARLKVCEIATSVEDAHLLMDILGIHPLQQDPLGIKERSKARNLYRKNMNRRIREKRQKGKPLTEEEIAYLEGKGKQSA
jgi:hypothetical protein